MTKQLPYEIDVVSEHDYFTILSKPEDNVQAFLPKFKHSSSAKPKPKLKQQRSPSKSVESAVTLLLLGRCVKILTC